MVKIKLVSQVACRHNCLVCFFFRHGVSKTGVFDAIIDLKNDEFF